MRVKALGERESKTSGAIKVLLLQLLCMQQLVHRQHRQQLLYRQQTMSKQGNVQETPIHWTSRPRHQNWISLYLFFSSDIWSTSFVLIAAWLHQDLGSSEISRFLKTASSHICKHVTHPQQILRDTMNGISLSLCGLWIAICDLYLEMSKFTKKSLNWIYMNNNVVIVSVRFFKSQRRKRLSHILGLELICCIILLALEAL